MRFTVAGSFFSILFWLVVNIGDMHGTSPAPTIDADKVNLALRRTADKLLRISGDSISRILPVEKIADFTWRIQVQGALRYDTLPSLLEASITQYGIHTGYKVTIRECATDIIALGYHQADFIQDTTVPCQGREEPQGCHHIEVTFDAGQQGPQVRSASGILLMTTLLLGLGSAWWWIYRRTPAPLVQTELESEQWISFGQSRLHATGQILEANGSRQSLTYREAKLLRLFAEHPDQLLDRERILQQVWADEGIQVGRSIDMFVSRLRKKLQADPSLGIVAVHGVGYRLEVKRHW